MSMRTPSAVLTLGALLFAIACAGGGPSPTPPPTTAAPAVTTAGAPPAGGESAAGTSGTSSITGKITYDGSPPPPEKVKTTADAKCQAMHPQGLEKRVIDASGGGLAHVFVWIKSGVSGSYPTPSEPVLLDQKGCMYNPHIITVRAGQPIRIRNSDDTLHNIHPRPTINTEFNMGQPRQGMESTKTFDKQEIMIPVGCDVHPWMRSYISVVSHPFFAVTGHDGTYEIKNVPPGDYEVEAYHEKLKNSSQKVSVKPGAPAKLDFAFKG